MPCGPQTKASSTGPARRRKVATLAASSRPALSGESTTSRENTGCSDKPRQVAVLQVLQFFLEHRRGGAAVAVQQRGLRACGVAGQQALQDRQDRRDAAAAGHRQHMARPPRQRGAEAALRLHHVEQCRRAAGVWCSQVEKAPPGTWRTPTRKASPGAAQIEYERRNSVAVDDARAASGTGRARSGRSRPASAGTSKVTTRASSASGRTLGHAQRVEVQAAHIGSDGLKYSKGSRQARQRYSALQAVEPKAERRSVSALPQRGQATPRGRMRTCAAPAATAAVPRAARCRRPAACARPSALIQSVVQAGASRCVTVTGPRPAVDERLAHALGDDLGGRAAAVGGREHDLDRPSSCASTSRTMPRSRTESTGTSGSGTASSAGQAASMRLAVAAAALTSGPRGTGAAATASRPG